MLKACTLKESTVSVGRKCRIVVDMRSNEIVDDLLVKAQWDGMARGFGERNGCLCGCIIVAR